MLVRPQVQVELGVIGGSGLYNIPDLTNVSEHKVYTPYGDPSDKVIVGELHGRRLAFIPRHGRGHRIPPHRINYRANIWALKSLGVKWALSFSAVGSLRWDYRPGDFVLPDQFIDFTKGVRAYTFFEGGTVCHVSMAEPFCQHLREVVIDAARGVKEVVLHPSGTYICIEGPRFSTKAESRVWRDVFKADVIGMTLVPEVSLACEAELCYATVAMVTDYDVWAEKPVTAEEVVKVMEENTAKAQKLLVEVVKKLPEAPDIGKCSCCKALEVALV